MRRLFRCEITYTTLITVHPLPLILSSLLLFFSEIHTPFIEVNWSIMNIILLIFVGRSCNAFIIICFKMTLLRSTNNLYRFIEHEIYLSPLDSTVFFRFRFVSSNQFCTIRSCDITLVSSNRSLFNKTWRMTDIVVWTIWFSIFANASEMLLIPRVIKSSVFGRESLRVLFLFFVLTILVTAIVHQCWLSIYK